MFERARHAVILVLFALLCWGGLRGGMGQETADLGAMLLSPSSDHWLGTDNMGRDLWGRLAGAILYTVFPLWGAILIATILGVVLGWLVCLSLEGNWAARALGYLVSAFFAALLAVPAGVFVFALAAWWEWTGRGLVMLVLGGLCLVRGALLIADLARRDRQLGWWKAHESMGGSWGARLWRYGIGGIWRGAIAELFVFHLKVALAVETALSYLQFGVQEPDPSFGNILASHFEMALHGQWRVLLTVLAGLLLVASLPASLVALLKVAPGARPKEVAHG